MAALDFPDSPTATQIFTAADKSWKFNNGVWNLIDPGWINNMPDPTGNVQGSYIKKINGVDVWWNGTSWEILDADPYWSSVVALYRFELENIPQNPATTTIYNHAQITPDPVVTNYSAGYYTTTNANFLKHGFRTPGNCYFKSATHAGWQFGTGDWTVEGWLTLNATTGDYRPYFDMRQQSTSGDYPTLIGYAGGALVLGDGTASLTTSAATTISGEKVYFAVTRTGGYMYIYWGGTYEGRVATTTNHNGTGIMMRLSVSGFTNLFADITWSEFRATKGVARYSQESDITPPVKPFAGY